jgi:hypothetical protein
VSKLSPEDREDIRARLNELDDAAWSDDEKLTGPEKAPPGSVVGDDRPEPVYPN